MKTSNKLTSLHKNASHALSGMMSSRPASRRIQILILTLWCMMGMNNPMIAQFTQWQQGAASDYYLNLNWSSTYNGAPCDCWVDTDKFRVFISGSPNYLLGEVAYTHVTTQTHSTSHPLGPYRIHNFFGTMNVAGNVIIPNFGCILPTCNGGPSSSSISMQTTAPIPPTITTPTWNADGSTTLHWTNNSDIPEANRSFVITQNGFVVTTVPGNATSYTQMCAQANEVYGIATQFSGTVAGQTYTMLGNPATYTIPNPRPLPTPPPMGKIQGSVTTLLGGSPVSGVTITAELLNPAGITNGYCWPSIYTDVTDAAGEYVIPFIYYGQGSDMAQYKITPSLPMHGFDPAHITRILQAGDFIKTQNFYDTTSFVISGTVWDITDCGLDSVVITATPGPVVPVYTMGDGTYELVVPQTGTYQVKATYDGIEIGTQSIVVNSNTGGHDFDYIMTDTLHGFVGAGCYEFIGQATLEIQSDEGCVLETIQTNMSGYYEVVLPSRRIQVQVIDYNPGNSGLNMNTVLNAIDDIHSIDLDSTTVLDIFYRKPISLEFYGIPDPSCPALLYPILEQGTAYNVSILVWEEPGICLADTGYIAIQNNVSTNSTQNTILDTIPVSNGVAVYTLIAGEPELSSPYVKTISFTAVVDDQTKNKVISAIVSGSRQRTATFTTGAPTSLPFLILRDPPGDLSKSFFNQDTTRSYSQSYSTLTSGGVKIWAKAKIGVDIFSIKAWGEISGAISVGGSAQTTEESLIEMSSSLSIETSSDEDVVGPAGDVIVGAAVNFIYGLADIRKFDLNTCSIIKDTALIFSPDTFATTFILTVDDIRNITIPALELLANNPDTTEAARARFRNEIRVWEQTLQLNEDLKKEALNNPIDNYTLSAGAGPVTLSTTGLATVTKTLEFKQYIQGDIAGEAGLEIGGSGGSLGVEVTIRGDFGQTKVGSHTIATTTGFTFDDNDNGVDLVSFDYARDQVYGTPVFGSLLGQTSCPHEDGTQFVDLPTMTTPTPVKFVPSGNTVNFTLTLGNISESNSTRTYVLDFIEQSNEFGALVFSGANPFSGTIPFTIPAGATTNTTVRIERPAGSPYFSFEGLQFDFYPLCEPQLKKTVYLSVYFTNTCSNITLASPGQNWLVNDGMNDEIDITMSEYVLGPDIDEVKLLYSPAGSQAWQESNIVIPGSNLLPPPQTYSWDVSEIPDGLYNIRLALVCDETINISPRVQGRIDRTAPIVFGNEEPKDDLLHPGDIISVSFKEDIDCSALTAANVYFRSVPENVLYPAQFICDGENVNVMPQTDITGLYNQAFEVGLIHVMDLFTNERPDTVKWQFVVSEPDSDEDGMPDTKDRCPGGNDFIDSDLDGLPDDCDCMPEVSVNGRLLTKAALDFDGVNDLVTVDNVMDMKPTSTNSVTIEGWFYARDAVGFQTIVSAYSDGLSSDFWIGTLNNQFFIEVYNPSIYNWEVGEFSVNAWTHFAVVFNQGQIKTYLNGILTGTFSFIPISTPSGIPVVIGSVVNPSTEWPFHGVIDEIRFWGEARTQVQIVDNMHHELIGNENGLVAYYNFNEGTPFGNNTDLTIIADKSSHNHTGSMSGFAKTGTTSNWINSTTEHLDIAYDLCLSCPDTINVAMDFDGINDKISIPNHPFMVPLSSLSMTIETWIYPRDITPGSADIIASSEGNLYLARLASDNIQVLTGNYLVTGPILPALKWSHLAVVFTQTSVKIYINGSLAFESATTHNEENADNPIGIGASILSNDYALNGKMDDLRFWNYARTGEQILNDMMYEVKGNEFGLVAYYNFNQGVPEGNNSGLTSVVDVTPNGHTGTLSGFAKTGIKSNWITSPFNFYDGDKDGLPDPCDPCFALKKLILVNQLLGQSIYRAEEEIILGPGLTVPLSPMIDFRAPKVTVTGYLDFLNGVINIYPEGCDD